MLNCLGESDAEPTMKHFLKRFGAGADRFEVRETRDSRADGLEKQHTAGLIVLGRWPSGGVQVIRCWLFVLGFKAAHTMY